MAIEATGILADSAQSNSISTQQTRTGEATAPDTDRFAPTEPGRDRFDPSASALRRRFVARFKQLSNEAFERPEEKHGIGKELKHRFRDALHTLKKTGLVEKSELKSLRKEFHAALKAVESTGVAAEVSSESSVEQSSTYSLDIETVEGDFVRIELQRQTQIEESFEFGSDGEDGITAQVQQSATRQSALSFTVEGDLSEDERAAIQDLVARVDQLAITFFDGDVQAALDHTQEFGLPDDEIAAFSVELGYSLTASVITAYREVEALAEPTDIPDANEALDLAADLEALADSTRLELLFVDSRSLVYDFFRGAVETNTDDNAGEEAA